jgi:hypothetical protein
MKSRQILFLHQSLTLYSGTQIDDLVLPSIARTLEKCFLRPEKNATEVFRFPVLRFEKIGERLLQCQLVHNEQIPGMTCRTSQSAESQTFQENLSLLNLFGDWSRFQA